MAGLRKHWKPIAVVGLTNTALPFLCFAYAALSLNAGRSAIFNSATPIFAALGAWLRPGDRETHARRRGCARGAPWVT